MSCIRSFPRGGGFTFIEVVVVLVVMVLLAAVLGAMATRARNADGLQISMANVGYITQAAQMYHADHAGQVPLRGCRYSGGQLNGWDTWNFGGKNCDIWWSTQIFDEPAYARFLNPYLYQAKIRKPIGYVNSGSGSTWNFSPGVPSAQDRESLEIPVFKSPGDVPTAVSLRSSYDDVGTSYHVNMKWWDSIATGTLTQRFNEGTRRIGLAFAGANPTYAWVHDQTADSVVNSGPTLGEFGKLNASVMGLADGSAAYLTVVPFALSGPGYTFLP